MTSRTWQMVAAALSVALMIVVIVNVGFGDEPAPASSQDRRATGTPAHVGGQLAPLQVYEHAKVGDWRAYRVTTESSMAATITATAITRVKEVTDTKVVRSFAGRIDATGEVRRDRDDDRPRHGLTIDQLTGNDVGGWTIYDLTITDEDHAIGGRTFKCKKLTYASDDPLIASKRTRTELWISTEVPVGGIVEEREVQEMPNLRFVITQQLIGFGEAGGTSWGTKPDGL